MREQYNMQALIANIDAEQEIIRHDLETHDRIAQWIDAVRVASSDAASPEMQPNGQQPAMPPKLPADNLQAAIRPDLDNFARTRQADDCCQLCAGIAAREEMLHRGRQLMWPDLRYNPASHQQAGVTQPPSVGAGSLEMRHDGQVALRYDLAMRNRLGPALAASQEPAVDAADTEMRPITHHTSLLNTPANFQRPQERNPTLPSCWDVVFEVTMDLVRGTERNGSAMARLPCIDGVDRWGPNAWN